MGAKALPEAYEVYLYCDTIFSGQSAQIRRLAKVTQLLIQNKESIAQLTCDFTIPAIAIVAAQLLKDKIFESQHLANQRFPQLLTSSSDSYETESSESEVEAAEAAGPKDDNKEGKGNPNDDRQDRAPESDNGDRRRNATDKAHDVLEGCEDTNPSAADRIFQQHAISELERIYLPFKTQHLLSTTVQRLLEECCFDFGHRWVPDLMKEKGWWEVESLELTQWTQWFPKAKELSLASMKPPDSRSVTEILSAIGAIRHAAVHRVRTSAEEILDMLGAAETFAYMLCDEPKVIELRQIKTELNESIKEIEGKQTLTRRELMERLDNIARSRAELDQLEKACVEGFRATDEKLRTDAGAKIEAYLDNPQKSSKSSDEAEKVEDSDVLESLHAPNTESEDGVMLSSFTASLQ